MKITTSKGKTFDASYIYTPINDPDSVMIDYYDDRKFSEIAEDWEDNDTLVKTVKNKPNVEETYKGFVKLTDMRRRGEENSVRIVLHRG